MTQKLSSILVVMMLALLPASMTNAQTVVASQAFGTGFNFGAGTIETSNSLNLISGFDSSLSMTNPGTNPLFVAYGVFNFSDFGYAPFTLADDSMFPVSGGVFEFDFEGILGGAKDPEDNFFTCTSTTCFFEPDELPCTANWTFDISSGGTEPLTLNIDMGQLSDDNFDGVPGFADILFEYSIDDGPFQVAFELLPIELVGSGFMYRDLDNGNNPTIDFFGDNKDTDSTAGTHNGLAANNPGVVKTLADTGEVAPNTILDKSDSATGEMDTFSIALNGTGSTLELRIVFDFSFEAFAMDNIAITTGGGGDKGIVGDVNCDGMVNLLDVGPFVDAVSNDTLDFKADVNGDGADNLLDVGPFVDLLTDG